MKRRHPLMLVADWTVLVGVGEEVGWWNRPRPFGVEWMVEGLGVGWWNRRRPFGEEWLVEGLGFGWEMVRYSEMPPLELLVRVSVRLCECLLQVVR